MQTYHNTYIYTLSMSVCLYVRIRALKAPSPPLFTNHFSSSRSSTLKFSPLAVPLSDLCKSCHILKCVLSKSFLYKTHSVCVLANATNTCARLVTQPPFCSFFLQRDHPKSSTHTPTHSTKW